MNAPETGRPAGRLEQLEFDNSFAALPEAFYTRLAPLGLPNPYLVAASADVAALIGIDPGECTRPEFCDIFAGNSLPPAFANGMFVGQHGSWNRKPRSGYRVIFVPFEGSKPAGVPAEVLGGFVDDDGQAQGRPVGVAIDRRGGLLVADDVGNVVWRLSAARR